MTSRTARPSSVTRNRRSAAQPNLGRKCPSRERGLPIVGYVRPYRGRDARDHGVEVRPGLHHALPRDCTLETRGLSNKDGAEIVSSRADQPFESIDDLWRRADAPVASLVRGGCDE
jgi:error-prone DNA polymerase